VERKKDEYTNRFGKNLGTRTGKSLEENVKLTDRNFPPTCNENRFYEYLSILVTQDYQREWR